MDPNTTDATGKKMFVPNMLCSKCAFLLRRYGSRVQRFLQDPSPEYMSAMGYDKDFVKFSADCEQWLQLLRKACTARKDPNSIQWTGTKLDRLKKRTPTQP